MKPYLGLVLQRLPILFALGLVPFACTDSERERAPADAGLSVAAPTLDASAGDAAGQPSAIDGAVEDAGARDADVRDADVRDASPVDGAASVSDSGCEGECVEFDELQVPVVWWSQRWLSGLCSATIAVDGAYRVWKERGCESAIDHEIAGNTSAQVFDSLSDQIDALPSSSDGGEAGPCDVLHTFGHRIAASETTREACGTTLDSSAGLPSSFATTMGTFQALP